MPPTTRIPALSAAGKTALLAAAIRQRRTLIDKLTASLEDHTFMLSRAEFEIEHWGLTHKRFVNTHYLYCVVQAVDYYTREVARLRVLLAGLECECTRLRWEQERRAQRARENKVNGGEGGE